MLAPGEKVGSGFSGGSVSGGVRAIKAKDCGAVIGEEQTTVWACGGVRMLLGCVSEGSS